MQLDRFVADLRAQLAASAEASTDEVRAAAERLGAALAPTTRLVLLEVLSEAAGEITRELAPGSVEVRLRGREPELVVTRPVPVHEAAREVVPDPRADAVDERDAGGASTSRTTLRLPDGLKARAEAAAAAEGVSVNTWLVGAVASALDGGRPGRRPESRTARLTGWVR